MLALKILVGVFVLAVAAIIGFAVWLTRDPSKVNRGD